MLERKSYPAKLLNFTENDNGNILQSKSTSV